MLKLEEAAILMDLTRARKPEEIVVLPDLTLVLRPEEIVVLTDRIMVLKREEILTDRMLVRKTDEMVVLTESILDLKREEVRSKAELSRIEILMTQQRALAEIIKVVVLIPIIHTVQTEERQRKEVQMKSLLLLELKMQERTARTAVQKVLEVPRQDHRNLRVTILLEEARVLR